MQRMRAILFAILAFAFVSAACSAAPTQIQPTVAPARGIESGQAIAAGELPRNETEVPRVSVEEAKAALNSGAAVIVDVRSSTSYEASHVTGAISIPLSEIESDLTSLTLAKEQWIITYCT